MTDAGPDWALAGLIVAASLSLALTVYRVMQLADAVERLARILADIEADRDPPPMPRAARQQAAHPILQAIGGKE